jgi:hypothetical protein
LMRVEVGSGVMMVARKAFADCLMFWNMWGA